MKSKLAFLSLIVLAVSLLTGCVFGETVGSDQVGAILDGGRIVRTVGPGVEWDFGLYSDLKTYSASTMLFEVNDASVATKDTQLVGVLITVQVRRIGDSNAVTNFLTRWLPLTKDDQLQNTVASTVSQSIKVGTRSMMLEQLLNDRNTMAALIKEDLSSSAAVYSVEVIDVTVKDVALDPAYMAILQQKANLTAQTEAALREQDLIKQQASNARLQQDQNTVVLQAQLLKEQAQTAVDVEIATREGKKITAANEVYSLNPQALQLELAKVTRDTLSNKSVLYFIPQGTSLSLLLNSMGSDGQKIVPVPAAPANP